MRGLKSVLSPVAALLCVMIAGCAGKPPANGPSSLNIAQFTLAQGAAGVMYRQLLVASGGVQPYTWSISSGGLPAGLSLSTDGLISGSPSSDPTQYPTSACLPTNNTFPITCNFAIKVTDSQSPIQAVDTQAESITVNADLSITSTSLGTATVGQAFTATVMASNGVPPYTYAVAFGTPCGTNNQSLCPAPGLTLTTVMSMNGMANAATISGTPTTAGVYSFTVQATDSATPGAETATANFTITVVGRLQGPYAISFNGFDSSEPAGSQAYYIVGELTAANDMNGSGTITGVIDQAGSAATPSGGTMVTGTYTIPAGTNFGTINFTRADIPESFQFNIVLSGTTSDSKLIEVDTSEQRWGSGLLKKQTSTALPGGVTYTFGSFGTDSSGDRFAGAGAFALSSALAVTGGAEDNNDNGTLSGEQCITGGSFSAPDSSTGRGTATLMVAPLSGGACGTATSNSYSYYVASANELIAVDTDSGGPATLVDIVQQQAAGVSGGLVLCTTGSNCQAALQLDGISSTAPETEVGVASFSSCTGSPCAGTFMRSDSLPPYYVDQRIGGDPGSFAPVTYTSGTYSVDASCGPMFTNACGRITIDLQGPTNQPVWYLSTTSQGFVVGGDADVLQGILQPQSPPTGGFILQSLLGSYLGGTITPVLPSVTNEIDVAGTPPPGGIWAQNYENSGPSGAGVGFNFTGTYGLDPTYGAAFGRFAICAPNTTEYCTSFTFDPNNPPLEVVYLAGGGTVGATGGKAGLVGFNLGALQANGGANLDPNPRLSTYGR